MVILGTILATKVACLVGGGFNTGLISYVGVKTIKKTKDNPIKKWDEIQVYRFIKKLGKKRGNIRSFKKYAKEFKYNEINGVELLSMDINDYIGYKIPKRHATFIYNEVHSFI